MKKRFTRGLIALSILAMSFGVNAATVQIGSGASAYPGSSYPIYTGFQFAYSQQIVLASEYAANGGGAGNITKIRFYYEAGGDVNTWKDWVIYMGHTTKQQFGNNTDWEDVSNLTEVFNGDVTASFNALNGMPGWMEITLDTPFAYDGTSNFVFAIDENTLGADANPVEFRNYSTGSDNLFLGKTSSTGNIDPANPGGNTSGYNYFLGAQVQFEGESTNCIPPTNLGIDNLSPTSVDLTWDIGTGSNWDIEWGSAGFTVGSGTLIDNVTASPYTLNVIQGGNDYEFYVRTDCGNGESSVWVGPFAFSTDYCTPVPTSVDGDGLINVTMGTVNNTTGIESDFYGDYTDLIVSAVAGADLEISVTTVTGLYQQDVWVWIDWNYDYDFNDAGEAFYLGEGANSDTAVVTNTVALLANAPNGTYRLRIGMADDGLGTTAPSDPCYTGTYAEFEDYTLEITGCSDVDNLIAEVLSFSSAGISWNETGAGSNWQVQYGESGFDLGAGTTVLVDSNGLVLDGLSESTSYDVYVRSLCGGADTSNWVGPITFMTNASSLDEVFNINISVYPNPSNSGLFHLDLEEEGELFVSDLTGKRIEFVYSDNMLDLSHLSKGTYLLTVNVKGSISSTRIVIQ